MELLFETVNVFTNQQFAGNPLAIVLKADGLTTQQMQKMAREFNLPETIFIQKSDDPNHSAKVRIFLPKAEIPFAGHPTIGCAIYLATQLFDHEEDFETEITLEEQAGLVPVKVSRKNGKIEAQFTAPVVPYPQSDHHLDIPKCALALGLDERQVSFGKHIPATHIGGPTFLFVPLRDRQALHECIASEPDCADLITSRNATGIYAYSIDKQTGEIHARMFAPINGIPEDPATGSATALLASQLLQAGELKEGLNSFQLKQGYDMGRPSDLSLEIDIEQSEITAVRVAGSSVAISSGKMLVPEL